MARSRFNLSNTRLLTGDMGIMYPAGILEVLPGDVFRADTSLMVRLAPMAAPVMHDISVRVAHHFVPHRLSYPKGKEGHSETFEEFITGGRDGMENFPLPTVTTTGVEKDLFDYLGCPVVAGIEVSSLPLRALNLVWNEWYRDQDLVAERDLEDSTLPRIAWEKDYFTTARPWPQKGAEVTLPLGTKAPVYTDAVAGEAVTVNYQAGDVDPYSLNASTPSVTVGSQLPGGESQGLFADLAQATAASITALREASGLQRFLEERARYGSRYSEYVRRAFGATPLDARLQRPELLAMGSRRVSVSEILQTAPEVGPDNRYGVGDMYGHGIALTRSNRFRTRFSEHGYIVTTVSVRPRAVYTNGIDRSFLRRHREDFFQRELAYIGQQQVRAREVYADATNADSVFGWSDRYAEYRYQASRAVAEYRGMLNYWHLARDFEQEPGLNETFVECKPSKRIFNVTDEDVDSLWMLAANRVQARRVVPRNATARLL